MARTGAAHPTSSPREVYATLGISKRDFYAALRWLEQFGFLQRGTGGLWGNATLQRLTCACGAEITPASAAFATSRGKVYRRKHCAACINAAAVERKRVWREERAL